MARYFFTLHDRFGDTPDDEGRDLVNLDEARTLAIADARSIMSEDVKDGVLALADYIEISDDSGELLLKLSFGEAVTIIG